MIAENMHLTAEQLEAGLPHVLASPSDEGTLEMIVRRPANGERERLIEGELDLELGLVGDNWHVRPSSRTPDRSPHPDMQLNVMNARMIDVIAQSRDRWQLAGDQLFVDLDLSEKNLPVGTRLAIGSAIIKVTEQPHKGCKKFSQRFGVEALKFVNSPIGKPLRLRGLCAKVVQAGTVGQGDKVRVIGAE